MMDYRYYNTDQYNNDMLYNINEVIGRWTKHFNNGVVTYKEMQFQIIQELTDWYGKSVAFNVYTNIDL